MKCVAQMPHPVAAPAATIQLARARPLLARARLNMLMAVKLARKQTAPATITSRQSCSVVRQVKTRNMAVLAMVPRGNHSYGVTIFLTLIIWPCTGHYLQPAISARAEPSRRYTGEDFVDRRAPFSTAP